MFCLCLGCRHRDNNAFGYAQSHGFTVWSFVFMQSVFLASIYFFLASTHFLTLLISPFHNLLFSLSPSASPTLYVWCVSFCSLLLEASEFTGEPVGLKTQAGVGVVAAERDGYNNPCSGSTHVLNYCHKCSPIRPRQDHHRHSAISSLDALSFSAT